MTALGKTGQLLSRTAVGALILLVRLYQCTLSPLMGIFGVHCRYQPSCSHYFIGAVEKYGAVRGAWRGIMRLCALPSLSSRRLRSAVRHHHAKADRA